MAVDIAYQLYSQFLVLKGSGENIKLFARIEWIIKYDPNWEGVQEVDQQWINSGAKQCSQRLNKTSQDREKLP